MDGLTVEHRTEPLGVDATEPRFGWRMLSERRGRAQGAYEILVASSPGKLTTGRADLWDSGRVRSADSVAVRYQGKSLKASTRYYWTVTVWDTQGRPVGSGPVAWFETGLMSTDGVTGWDGAQWIGMRGKTPNSPGAPMLRAQARLRGRVREARLYVSALGVYDAYVSGHRVTVPQDGGTTLELLPSGWTNYDVRVNYLSYDVTRLVAREHDVTLAAVLGNGWYNGRISGTGSTSCSRTTSSSGCIPATANRGSWAGVGAAVGGGPLATVRRRMRSAPGPTAGMPSALSWRIRGSTHSVP